MAYVRKQVTLPPLVAEMLKEMAISEGEPEARVVADAIKDYVRRYNPDIEIRARKTIEEEMDAEEEGVDHD